MKVPLLSRDFQFSRNTLIQIATCMSAVCCTVLATAQGSSAAFSENTENQTSSVSLHAGVYEDRVVFGQSACMSGPSKELGLNYQHAYDLISTTV